LEKKTDIEKRSSYLALVRERSGQIREGLEKHGMIIKGLFACRLLGRLRFWAGSLSGARHIQEVCPGSGDNREGGGEGEAKTRYVRQGRLCLSAVPLSIGRSRSWNHGGTRKKWCWDLTRRKEKRRVSVL